MGELRNNSCCPLTSRGIEPQLGVLSSGSLVLDDLPSSSCDQRIDQNGVSLVTLSLHRDVLAGRLGSLHQLLEGDGLCHVETGLLRHRFPIPQQLSVGPEWRSDQLAFPVGCVL